MADSIAEQIAQNIESVLDGISVANGYETDIAEAAGGGGAQRYRQDGQSYAKPPLVVVGIMGEDKEQQDNDCYHCRLHFVLEAFGKTPTGEAENTDGYVDALVRDIEKALMVDPTRGLSSVIDTVLLGYQQFAEEIQGAPFAGADIAVDVIYKHRVNNPFVGV